MAFWNKNKAKENANNDAFLSSEPKDQAAANLEDGEDELIDILEDDLPESDTPDTTENDLMEVETMSDTDLFTAISRNAEIVGNIVTSDNLEVYGNVEGNILSEALVKVYGTVNGQISCDTLIASGAKITGDITCKELLEIRANTDIEGDVVCSSAVVSGNLLGNITADSSTSLSSTAVVNGNVATPEFEVAKGAILNGSVSIKKGMAHVTEVVNPTPIAIAVQPDIDPIRETPLMDSDDLLDDELPEAR